MPNELCQRSLSSNGIDISDVSSSMTRRSTALLSTCDDCEQLNDSCDGCADVSVTGEHNAALDDDDTAHDTSAFAVDGEL